MNALAKYLVLAFAFYCGRVRSQDCSLEGYDLATLNEAPYWSARVPDPKDCLLPLGYSLEEVESCDIYYSACKPLGNECGDHVNSTSCQKVVANQTEYYYDMGAFDPDEEYQSLGGDTLGFSVIRVAGESAWTEDCNKTVQSITTFVCDSESMWDPTGDKNVTSDLKSIKEILHVSCLYAIEFRYHGGCYLAPTLSPSHCMIDNYDTETLKSQDYWMATVDSSACYDSSVTKCVFYLSFCHPVSPIIGSNCYGSSVCQIGTYSDDQTRSLSMGAYANFTNFHENDEQGLNGGFYMRVENGSRPNNGSKCANGMSTQVTLICDSSAVWNGQDISKYVMVAYHHDDEPCSYMLKISYNGACIQEGPIVGSKQSPFGWILIAIVAVAVIGYLSVGVLYNKLKKGATGLQLIPHYDFWFNFVMLVLGGCYFFLDAITCFKFDGKVKLRRQPDYDKI